MNISMFYKVIQVLVTFFFVFNSQAATIYFNSSYVGTVNAGSINNVSIVAGNTYSFTSLNPNDATFSGSGNDISGVFSYFTNSGQLITLQGIISRQNKSGNTTNGLFFYPNNSTTVGYILVIPDRESSFTVGGSYGSSSDPMQSVMNNVLSSQQNQPVMYIDNPQAIEGNPYIQFHIYFSNNGSRTGTSSFQLTINPQTALPNEDYLNSLEYSFNQSSWLSGSGTLNFPTNQGSMYIRIPLVDDTIKECIETLILKSGTISGGNILNNSGTYGTGRIIDQENYYLWLGITNNSWQIATNWMCEEFPISGGNIVINPTAPNNLVLDQNRTVGYLHFNGSSIKVRTEGFVLTASSIIASNSNCYIQTTSIGQLKLVISNNQTKFFPVGNNAYNPLSITNKTGSTDFFLVRVLDEMYENGYSGSIYNHPRIKRTWDINKTNPNGGNGVDFVFNWNTNENYYLSIPKLFHHEGGQWNLQTGLTSYTTNSLSYTAYNGTFSPFSISEETALAVSLIDFKAQCFENKSIKFKWATSSEINSSYFDIEESKNGINWDVIKSVNSIGNSNLLHNYSATISRNSNDLKYYRLVQYDINGTFEIYNPITLDCENNEFEVNIFPNPVDDQFSIYLNTDYSGEFLIQFISTNGKIIDQFIYNAVNGVNIIELSSINISTGIYFIQIKDDKKSITKKLVVN